MVAASVYTDWMQFSRAEPDLLGQRAIGLTIAAFGLVGALLLYRRPGHRLGWLLAGIGVLALLGGSANEYVLAVTQSGSLASDFLAWLVWFSNWFGGRWSVVSLSSCHSFSPMNVRRLDAGGGWRHWVW